MSSIVVKVGGSLFDLPDLKPRLTAILDALVEPVVLVPGGGAAADVIRAYDRDLRLGDEAAHWLALRACSLNGHVLSTVLGLPIIAGKRSEHPRAILDLFAFAVDDEQRADRLPHHWDVTSDSMALRVAQVFDARELVLLKSMDKRAGAWEAAGEAGFVDPFFAKLIARSPSLRVNAVNLRSDLDCVSI